MTDTKNKNKIFFDMLLLILLAVFGFWVNRDIVIKGLYMDDLYMWSCYGEQSLKEFVFPVGTSTRFRPVYWFAAYLQMFIVGNHINRFVGFNIVVNLIVAVMLYHMSAKLSRSRITAFFVGAAYLASRFAYYQIGQALGLMETMALGFAIAILWLLYRYMKEGKGYYPALMVFFLLVFTHERYLSLFPLFYLVLILRAIGAKPGVNSESLSAYGSGANKTIINAVSGETDGIVNNSKSDTRKIRSRFGIRNIAAWITPAAELVLIVIIRMFTIGKAMPAGTGGTEVTDTFGLMQTINFCKDQIKYIFGINAGPEYLNGLPWEMSPAYIQKTVIAGCAVIGCVVLIYIAELIRRKDRKVLFEAVSAAMLFGGFIALCIGCSSVTIRLEMRWIYVSFTAALLYAAYMIGFIGEDRQRVLRTAALSLFAVYAVITIYLNIFYRGYFINIYFWHDQLRMNSLAEQTVEKYGMDNILGKDIYILENSYGMSEFYADTFFKTFDKDKKAEGTKVIFADDKRNIDTEAVKEGRALVIKELPEEHAYLDITEEVKAAQ
mgnify:FL=1